MSDSPSTASRWWYVLVLAPMVASLLLIVGTGVVTVAAVSVPADLSTYAPAYFALAAMGLPTAALYPLALYRDASRVADRDVAWTPSPDRYALTGILASLTGLALSIPLSWYYLRKRRRHVGLG